MLNQYSRLSFFIRTMAAPLLPTCVGDQGADDGGHHPPLAPHVAEGEHGQDRKERTATRSRGRRSYPPESEGLI